MFSKILNIWNFVLGLCDATFSKVWCLKNFFFLNPSESLNFYQLEASCKSELAQ